MTDNPFALHITWTTYGTWMPGDERGHVSTVLQEDGTYRPRENRTGAPVAEGDQRTRERAEQLMKHPVVWLSPARALIVAESLVEAARKRAWHIRRAAVMANHVHVLVMNCPNDESAVRRILKGNTDAALRDATGESRRWWTAGGSGRYKNDHQAIENADRYIAVQERMLGAVCDMVISIGGVDYSRGDEPRGS